MTLYVFLYGGPGAGKTSTLHGLMHELMVGGINAEAVTEYAKGHAWDQQAIGYDRLHPIWREQLYLFAKQIRALRRVRGLADVCVTDSPPLLSLYYGMHERPEFHALVRAEAAWFNPMNVLLRRVKPYNTSGRYQTAEQAEGIDAELRDILDAEAPGYEELPGDRFASSILYERVARRLGKEVTVV